MSTYYLGLTGGSNVLSIDEVANDIGYAGYIFNDESLNYHVRNREYSPTLGRWLQRDPIGYRGSAFALYEFGVSSPNNNIDWNGAQAVPLRTMPRRAPLRYVPAPGEYFVPNVPLPAYHIPPDPYSLPPYLEEWWEYERKREHFERMPTIGEPGHEPLWRPIDPTIYDTWEEHQRWLDTLTEAQCEEIQNKAKRKNARKKCKHLHDQYKELERRGIGCENLPCYMVRYRYLRINEYLQLLQQFWRCLKDNNHPDVTSKFTDKQKVRDTKNLQANCRKKYLQCIGKGRTYVPN